MFRGRAWFAGFVLFSGCATAPSPSVPPAVPPTPALAPEPQSIAATKPAEAATPRRSIRIVPVVARPHEAAPHVEVKFPLAGKRIATQKAHDYVIRLAVSAWSDDLRLMLLLDDLTPRLLESPEENVTLADLLPEDRELEPGSHHLFVTAVRPPEGSVRLKEPRSRAAFAEVAFWIGEAEAAPPDAKATPRLVHLAPSGTFNGSHGEKILVDFRVLDPGAPEHEVEVEVTRVSPGPPASGRLRLPGSQQAMIQELASGDYEVTVRLLDASGNVAAFPDGVKSRTITVNRDAPEVE